MAGYMTLKILVPQAFVKPLIIISIIFISLESALEIEVVKKLHQQSKYF